MERSHAGKAGATNSTGPIPRPRVRASEWLVGAGGIAVLAGLFMPWAAGESAFEAFSLLKLLVVVAALAAVAVPVVVAASSRTDLPVVWETFLSTYMLLLVVLLAVRLVWPPDGGLESGFFTVAGGCLLITIAGWVSVSRED